jgi:hypothetical protein
MTISLPFQILGDQDMKKESSTFTLVAEQQPSTTNPSAASAAHHKNKLIYRPAKKHYALGEAERTFSL